MRNDTRSLWEQTIRATLDTIHGGLDGDVSFQELADAAGFSPYHFHRVFRSMVGEGVHECAKRLRLERAAHELKATSRSASEIALDAGFDSLQAFTKAFKSAYVVPPSEFRKRHEWPPRLSSATGVHFQPDGGPVEWEPLDTGGKTMDVTIVELEPINVVCMRHIGPYNAQQSTWKKLMGWAVQAGLDFTKCRMISVYHDNPDEVPADQLRSDMCMSVAEGYVAGGEVSRLTIPGGTFAKVVHKGAYDKLGDTWARLCGEWIPASEYDFREGMCFEEYTSDCATTPEEDLETLIFEPVQKRA